MEGCGKGRKQGGASRKGNQEGRDNSMRHRDPPREKDIDLSHIERAKHWSERGAWGIWVWLWAWAKSRNKENESVRDRKKSTTTSCCGGSGSGDKQGGRARSFWPWTCFGIERSPFFRRERKFWVLEERESLENLLEWLGESVFDKEVLGCSFFWVCVHVIEYFGFLFFLVHV